MESETPEQQTPAEAPAPAPAPSAGADIDQLLRDFENATQSQPEPATEPDNTQMGGTEIDRLLADLGPDPRVGELETQLGTANGELNALRQAEFERAEQKAFDTFVDAIKQQIPDSGLPDTWVSDKLLAMAVQDRNLLEAWEYRNADRTAIDKELRRVEAAYDQMQRAGGDPQKLAQLHDYGMRLGRAYNAQAILSKAERAVIKEAKAHKVYDPDVSADREAVVAAMRGASAPMPAEAPPNLGAMDTQQYRAYLKSLGITPGF